MVKALKIGITGGIGSGKTTVSNLFRHLGVPLYLADERARWLMNNNKEVTSKVRLLFGNKAYIKGELNRAYISSRIFTDKNLIAKLNSVVHPAVADDFIRWSEKQQTPYVIKEAALLFESGSYLDLDAIITVDAPEEIRIIRTMKRDQVNRADVLNRIKNQMPSDLKNKAADFLIANDGDTPLLPQVLQLHQLWTA